MTPQLQRGTPGVGDEPHGAVRRDVDGGADLATVPSGDAEPACSTRPVEASDDVDASVIRAPLRDLPHQLRWEDVQERRRAAAGREPDRVEHEPVAQLCTALEVHHPDPQPNRRVGGPDLAAEDAHVRPASAGVSGRDVDERVEDDGRVDRRSSLGGRLLAAA
ncbi:hypothetical protein [Cellulomonas fimi]|uniref:hypothetical protein n=1 Tax=Cellulomonas fimi TaxID=1708 RepID=UPI000F847061|nr:hypothetical protein [Cellulomonas fimi]NNH05568.1 hypothetical protein [Cellulomonas fimi]